MSIPQYRTFLVLYLIPVYRGTGSISRPTQLQPGRHVHIPAKSLIRQHVVSGGFGQGEFLGF